MDHHPLVSVVMTVYNAERYLAEAIESVLSQTLKEFEFIIVDNASQDKSLEIIKSYKDPRIIFIKNSTNLGQTKALNIGIQASQTEFIARMDADDICLPQRLEKQLTYLKHNKDTAVVGSWCIDIDSMGNSRQIYKVITDPFLIKCHLSASGDLTSWCITHPSVMMRKSMLVDVGLYNEAMSLDGYPQDYDLWMRIIAKYSMANIAEPLLKYRVLDKSESRAFSDKTMQYRMLITATKIRRYMKDWPEGDIDSLTRMLEYIPQDSSQQGEKVLKLFDSYFNVFMDNEKDCLRFQKQKARIKFYYLPVLFSTNKFLALGEMWRVCLRYPEIILDERFYKKLIKGILKKVLLPRKFDSISRSILLKR
jgi:glycosyltransferase involved in cell wall biosynthesis